MEEKEEGEAQKLTVQGTLFDALNRTLAGLAITARAARAATAASGVAIAQTAYPVKEKILQTYHKVSPTFHSRSTKSSVEELCTKALQDPRFKQGARFEA